MKESTTNKILVSSVGLIVLAYITLVTVILSLSCNNANVRQHGMTTVQAAQLLMISADTAIDDLVKNGMNKCAMENQGFENPEYNQCMNELWKIQDAWNKYAKPGLATSIIAATASLTAQKKDCWKEYLKKGLCIVGKFLDAWQHLIPYSDLIHPLISPLIAISCD